MNRFRVLGGLIAFTFGCGEAQVQARQWCVQALFANGEHSAAGNTPIVNSSGNYTSGCKTMCMFEHNVMVEGEINEDIDEMDPLYDHWQFLRGLVYDRAESICEQWADELEVGSYSEPYNVMCADAVAAQSPYLRPSSVLISQSYCLGGGATFTGGTGTGTGGDDDDDGADGDDTSAPPTGPAIYGLTSYDEVLDCSGAIDRICDVDENFLTYVFDNVDLLWQDDVLLEPVTSPAGIKFTTCGTDSLLYALGFRQNDIITDLEIFEIPFSLIGRWDLFGHIAETGYETIRADLLRSGRDYTITVTQTEFCADISEPCSDSSDCCDSLICNVSDVCAIPL